MIRKIGILNLLIFLIMTISGCWSRRELNDIAIVLALGIDQKGKQFQVSTQIVNPSEIAKKQASTKSAPVVTYSETGETIIEALQKVTSKSPRKLYFAHLRMLIISEKLAKKGIVKSLDYLSRDHEIRTDFFIAIARRVSAAKILEVYTISQELIPANKIYKSIQTSSYTWSATGKVTIDELISDIISDGKQPVVTAIEIEGSKINRDIETEENVRSIRPMSSLKVSGFAVFKEDKLVGWLNENESKGYNYIMGKVKGSTLHVACPQGGKLALEVIRSSSKVKGNTLHGRPKININVHVEGNVSDVECHIGISETKTIDELEKRSKKEIASYLEDVLQTAQKTYKSDIFGFGEAIHRSDPKTWKKLKSRWNREFIDLPVHVNVNVKIRGIGTVTDSLQNK